MPAFPGQTLSSWLIRTVRLWTCSDVPEIGSETVGVFVAFDVTCSVDVNVPAVVGAKSTCTVHESAAAMVGVADAQGLAPPPTANA